MRISEISIKNHVFAWMLMASLLIFGGLAFSRMGVSQLPDVDFPVVSVNVSMDGASPEVMDLNVVDVIEGTLASVPGIKSMTSSARTGNASISLEFDLDKNINTAVQEVQSALARIQKKLPNNVDPPTVSKSNPDDQPIIFMSVSAEGMSRKDLMKLVRDQVQDRFTTVEGVGQINLWGYLEPNLRVWLSQEKLNQFQLTASDVIKAIQLEHAEQPGGRIENAQEEMNIRTLGEAPSVADFENIAITRRGGTLNFRPIALKEVAQVEDGLADERSLSRAQGKVAVSIAVTKQPGANAVEVAKAIKARMQEVATQLPKGVEIQVRFDTSQFIEESVHELNFTLIFSALLTALVCWMFLGSWSATLNVILAIPTSVVGSFIALKAMNFTLNTFTLLGLSLAIGIVVDDAIMVLENIVRHREMGKDRVKASLDGSLEITGAAIAATIAIIAIFLPVAFMEGVIGRYFLQFGVTLTVAVAISLLEALTLTPMRTSRYLTITPRRSWFGRTIEGAFEAAAEGYKKIIPLTLNHPWLVLTAALGFFIGTLTLWGLLKKEFVPPQDQSRLMVRVQTAVGSSLAMTNEKVREVEKYFSSRSEVAGYFVSVGGGMQAAVNAGNIFLTLKPPKERQRTAQQLANEFRKDLRQIEGVRVSIQDPSLSSLGASRSFPVQFTIKGPDWNRLVELSEQVTKEMEQTHLMTDVDTNYQSGMPELHIVPDRVKARQYGVDVSEITSLVSIMMSGAIAGKFSQDGRRYDVRVALPTEARGSIDALKGVQVRNNQGELIGLDKVVHIEKREGLQAISREDRQRAITVRANVAAGSSQQEAINATQEITRRLLPPGYSTAISGSAKTFQESFQGLLFALLLGILVSYMVLASQFNSFIHPITILLALPFSVSGAFIALYLGGQTLNIYSLIGLILLMGIVKKNSILLVEFASHLRAQGTPAREALVEACPIRLRPILMTSIATIAGAIPPALAIGPGAESRIPMALAVIGGVLVSTVLTLFVVPSAYVLFDRFQTGKESSPH